MAHDLDHILSDEAKFIYKAPARINLIGEHIDYNGGFVFPCAISRYIFAYVSLRKDKEVHLSSFSKDSRVGHLDKLEYDENMKWEKYPLGIFYILKQRGYDFPYGLNIHYESDIPTGSGLSSSAALLVVTTYLINDIYHLGLSKKEITFITKAVENEYCHLQSGIMDQAIICLGQKNKGMLLDCSTFKYDYYDIDLGDYEFVVLKSNKPRSLVTSKYNDRVSECNRALSLLKDEFKITKLVDLRIEDLDKAKSILNDDVLYRRVRHVVSEADRVNQFVEALKKNDILSLGTILNESHISLRDDYEVTGLHLDALFECSKVAGAIGVRMTGAGFGGCAIALIKKSDFATFKNKVCKDYYCITNLIPDIFEIEIVDGVSKVK